MDVNNRGEAGDHSNERTDQIRVRTKLSYLESAKINRRYYGEGKVESHNDLKV